MNPLNHLLIRHCSSTLRLISNTEDRFSQGMANLSPSIENLTLLQSNNKDTDQSALPRSLISATVIRLLESIILKLT